MKRIFLLTLIVCSVFGLLYIALFIGYLRERSVQSALQEQVDVLSQAVVNEPPGDRQATLQAALATAQAEQAALRYIFPSALDSTEIVAHIVRAAAENHIRLQSVQAQTPLSITSETGTYEVLRYELRVEGTLPDVSAFVQRLEDGTIGTLTLETLSMSLVPPPTPTPAITVVPTPTPAVRRGTPTPTPAPTATPTPTPEPGLERYRVTLLLQIYTRQQEATPTPQP